MEVRKHEKAEHGLHFFHLPRYFGRQYLLNICPIFFIHPPPILSPSLPWCSLVFSRLLVRWQDQRGAPKILIAIFSSL